MNNGKFQEILDSLPEKPARSRLQPYRVLIEKLRRRGRTYREIVGVLAERCNLQVSVSTLHDFVRAQSQAQRTERKNRNLSGIVNRLKRPASDTTTNPMEPTSDEVHERILALKHRSLTVQPVQKLFHYDPDEPLHLPDDIRKRHPSG